MPAVVTAVGRPAVTNGTRVRLGRYQAELTRESIAAWPRTPNVASFTVGDLIEVGLTSVNEANGQAAVTLEQTPLVEGALVAIENRTGQIRAMVGAFTSFREYSGETARARSRKSCTASACSIVRNPLSGSARESEGTR